MGDVIYKNIEDARAAVVEYVKAIYELQANLGVWEENEDSCSATYTYARYYDERGNVRTVCIG